LYADVVDGTFGPALRLEQERISFDEAYRRWQAGSPAR
jgi:hypothetical protein